MKAAKELEAEWRTEIARGTALDPAKTTVAQLLTAWLESKADDITPNTRHDYATRVNRHIVPAIGNVRVQTLTAAQVQAQYQAWRDGGMSARMVRACHTCLTQALKQAVQFGIVSANPCDSVTPPKIARSKANVWSADEASQFLRAAMTMPVLNRGGHTGRYRVDELNPLWYLLLLEGMRRGEALGLRWRDINLERGTAHIVQTIAPDKANKGRAIIQERTKTHAGARTVRLTAQTIEALKVHRKLQDARRLAANDWVDLDLIICSSRGTAVNPNNVTRNFNAITTHAGLRRIRVHDLRHTSATLLLLAGVPAKIVSERLGHASIAVTLDIYSHVLPAMQDSAADAINAILTAAEEPS
jgi:integrase